MEARSWNSVDKSAWGDGPWQSEPDKMQWQDEATGFACLIVRDPMGALCGYVGVPETHPAHGLSYDGTPDEALRFIISNPATAMNMLAKALHISPDDPWSRGFAACLYLFNDRYDDYRRERDKWLKEKYE